MICTDTKSADLSMLSFAKEQTSGLNNQLPSLGTHHSRDSFGILGSDYPLKIMPILLHEDIVPVGELGIWQITEPEPWFREQFDLSPAEETQLELIKGHRRLEYLAARQLVHVMSGRDERGAFIKDAHGKPRLEGSAFQISVSHSHGLSAAIAAPGAVGIDIQFLVPKIERLAHRVFRPEELATLEPATRLLHLHVYWGAKEALYKAYGRRQLHFRENLLIDPFHYRGNEATFSATVQKDDYVERFQGHYQLYGDYMLVYVRENALLENF